MVAHACVGGLHGGGEIGEGGDVGGVVSIVLGADSSHDMVERLELRVHVRHLVGYDADGVIVHGGSVLAEGGGVVVGRCKVRLDLGFHVISRLQDAADDVLGFVGPVVHPLAVSLLSLRMVHVG